MTQSLRIAVRGVQAHDDPGRTDRDRELGMSYSVGLCGGALGIMVAWEKRRSLVMKSCLISIPALRILRWRACA